MYAYDGVKAAAVEIEGEIFRAADAFHAEGPRAAPALEAVAHAEYAGQMPVYEGVAVAYHLAVDAGQEIERVDYSALAAAFAAASAMARAALGVSAAVEQVRISSFIVPPEVGKMRSAHRDFKNSPGSSIILQPSGIFRALRRRIWRKTAPKPPASAVFDRARRCI